MTPQNPRLTATILWAALLAGPTLFLVVAAYLVFGSGMVLGPDLSPETRLVLLAGSLALSLVTVGLSWRWAMRLKASAWNGATLRGVKLPPGPEADGIQRLVLACALCEFGAIGAVVALLLTGSALALAPYALSWLALAAHFPGERRWAELTGRPAGAGRQNPMIRG